MPELKLGTVCTVSSTYGTILAHFGEQKLEFIMTKIEVAEINALALRFVQARQQALAEEIRTAQPALLMPPQVEDATYDEVSF